MLLGHWLTGVGGVRRDVSSWWNRMRRSRRSQRNLEIGQQRRLSGNVEPLEIRSLLSAITVTSLEDNTLADGLVTLREAIQAANTDSSVDGSTAGNGADTIVFDASLFSGGAQVLRLNGTELTVVSELSLVGPGAGLLTINGDTDSNGAGNSRLFKVTDGNSETSLSVSISGLTLTHGVADFQLDGSDVIGGGGAIFNAENLTVASSHITGNSAPNVLDGSYETRLAGGGIQSRGSLSIVESTISGNSATGSGGGIDAGGQLLVLGSTISNNSAAYSGGAIATNGYATLAIADSTISGNQAGGSGGGLALEGITNIHQSTISGNAAQHGGGGISFFGSSTDTASLVVAQSTITGNVVGAAGVAGGVGASSSYGDSYQFTLKNSIVAGNSKGGAAADIAGTATPGVSRHNLIGDSGSAGGLTNGTDGNIVGVSVATVLNATLANNGGPTFTHALLAGSPAINAGGGLATPADAFDADNDGNTTETIPFDQRGVGFVRINGTQIDIGAFESGTALPATLVGMKFNDTNGNGYRDEATVELDWTTVASELDLTRPLFPNINGGLSFPYTVVNGGSGVVTYLDGLPASEGVVANDGDVTFAFGQSVAPYTGTPALTLETFDNGATTGFAIQRFRPESGVTNNAFTIFNAGVAVVTGTLNSVDVYTFPTGSGLDSVATAVIQLTGVPGGADATIYNELLTATGGSGTLFVDLSTFDFEGEAAALDDGAIFLSEGEIDNLTSGSEVGLPGWTIYVDLNNDGDLDAGEPSAVTDASGHYTIGNLAAGSRTVREVAQAGWKASFDHYSVLLVSGQTSFANFGNFADGFGTITGVKWNDLDNDGIRDTTPSLEPGLSGWTIFVDLDDDGELDGSEPSAVTAADGSYSITNVPSGRHYVTEVLQLGWGQTIGDEFLFVPANETVTVNFGNRQLTPGTISGSKWNDLNGDGFRASTFVNSGGGIFTQVFTDLGLDDWTIYVDLNNNGTREEGEPFAVTVADDPGTSSINEAGRYTITGVPAGSLLTVREEQKAGWVASRGTNEVFVNEGQTLINRDFGNYQPDPDTGIHGTKWHDHNGDGDQDVGDEFLPGWTIYVDLDNNGVLDNGEPFAVTNANGEYSITGLLAGSTTIREVAQAGQEHWIPSLYYGDHQTVFLYNGESEFVEFANLEPVPGSISGVKWHDLDGDFLREEGEPGLAGWTIYIDANENGVLDPGELNATTGVDGSYTIANVPYGSHFVREVSQPESGYVPSLGDHSVFLLNGQNLGEEPEDSVDFGNFIPVDGSVSGVKWNDLNGNSFRDPNEPLLSGWKIYVDENEDGMFTPGEPFAVTAEEDLNTPEIELGTYTITGVQYGYQTIREVPQAGWEATSPNNFFGEDGVHYLYVYNGQNVEEIDFGNFFPNTTTTITGTKWNDHNGDGEREAGDEGLAGWTIYADLNFNYEFDEDDISDDTDEDGNYSLSLPANFTGSVYLYEVAQAGWTASIGFNFVFVSRGGTTHSGEDFANYRAFGNVTGVKWEDVNGDGERNETVLSEPSLVGWFQGETDAHDSARGNDGSVLGGTSFAQAVVGNGFTFDSNDDVVSIPHNNLYNASASGFTVGFWMQGIHNQPESLYLVVDKSHGWVDATGWAFQGDSTTGQLGLVFGNGSTFEGTISTTDLLDGAFHHVVGVWDGSRVRLYVDGIEQNVSDPLPAPAGNNRAINIGYSWGGGSPNRFFRGGVDDLQIYSRALSASEISALYATEQTGVAPFTPSLERGLGGWTIFVDADFDGILDAGEVSTVTDANGAYTLTDVPAGFQYLSEVPQLGWQATLGNRYVEIPISETTTANFGNRHLIPGSISGLKWNDLNGDSSRAFDEPALSGWTIYVDFNGDGDRDPGEPFAVTAIDDPETLEIDETGTYVIGNVPAGSTLWIREEPQAGWIASRGDHQRYIHEDFAQTSVNFGNYEPIAESGIQGIKYHDHNGNGTQDEGDEPLGGWTIYVDLDDDGEQDIGEPFTVTTEVTGAYSFSGLLAGSYTLREVMQPGYVATPGYGGELSTFVYNSTEKSTLNFANFLPVDGSISGVKWNDLDADGTHDANEPGLPNWIIYSDANGNGLRDAGELFDETDANGNYTIEGVQYGYTLLREVGQPSWTQTTGDRYLFVYNGQDVVNQNFGNFTPAAETTISGTKWNDRNANSVRDPGDEGLSGWTIFADFNLNNQPDVGEPQAVTDANGNYTLTGFGNRIDYSYLREVAQEGWTASVSPGYYSHYISQVGVTIAGEDFANYRPIGTINGVKWHDLDGDTVREEGEPLLAGWTIYWDLNGNIDLDDNEPSTVTDANGAYSLVNIPSGTYALREVQQLGWQMTHGDRGVFLPIGGTLTEDFGNLELASASVSGTKWNDLNGDGFHQVDEPGLAGWTIYVDLNGDGDRDGDEPFAITSSTAGEVGEYFISNVPAGDTYWIREELQATWIASRGDRQLFIQAETAHTGIDFFNYQLDPDTGVTGTKWYDHNANGFRDENDQALSGWTIFVDVDEDGTFDDGEPSAVTNGSGQYLIPGLTVGNHRIAEVLQGDYVASLGNRTVFVYNGDPTAVDFGNYIGGTNNPDLKVENLNATTPNAAGELTISWTTANRGARETSIGWTERVVVRNNTTGAVLFNQQYSEAGGLLADGTRAHSVDAFVGDGGQYEVLVTTDFHNDLFEFNAVSHEDAEANNSASSFFDVFLDLQVINVTVDRPVSPQTGDSVTVHWSVQNTGDRNVESWWYDRVIVQNLTTGQTIYNQTVYHDTSSLGDLAPGQSHARSHTFDLPDGDAGVGNLQITITTDTHSNIGEFNDEVPENAETNNSTSSDAFAVTLAPYPDLVASQVSLTPADPEVLQLQSGMLVTVKWTDSNLGTAPAGSYYDYVRVERVDAEGDVLEIVSSRVIAVNGLEVTDMAHPALEQQYSFNLPDGPRGVGLFRVVVTTDYYGQVFEHNGGGTAEENTATSANVSSTLAPYADLISRNLSMVSAADAGATLVSGMTVKVSWDDVNLGNATTGAYRDYVLIDRVNDDDPDHIQVLETVAAVLVETSALAPDSAETPLSQHHEVTLRLPDGARGAGRFRVRVFTDYYGEVVEYHANSDAENNQFVSAPQSVGLAAYPDLIVGAISGPATGRANQEILIDYTITNRGNASVTGEWTDWIFLSDDTEIGDDQFIGSFTYSATIGAGESLLREDQPITLPGFTSGSRYLVVRTDVGNAVFEYASPPTADGEQHRHRRYRHRVSSDAHRLRRAFRHRRVLRHSRGRRHGHTQQHHRRRLGGDAHQ